MSEKEKKELKDELRNIKNRVLYPILVIILIGFGTTTISYLKQVKRNARNIEKKVDQERFNEYLTIQNKINTLSEERQRIMSNEITDIKEKLKKIEELNTEIARLQEQVRILLSDYTMRTRDGGEIIFPIEYFITEA